MMIAAYKYINNISMRMRRVSADLTCPNSGVSLVPIFCGKGNI